MSIPQLSRDFISALDSSAHKWITNDFPMEGSNILGEEAELKFSGNYHISPNITAGLLEKSTGSPEPESRLCTKRCRVKTCNPVPHGKT